jgi:uncharacterized protein (TIGR03000 family)
MNRTSSKCLLIGAVVAVVLFAAAPQADAQWWGYYRPAAWGCCYAPTYASPCCTTVAYSNPCYYGSDWYLGVRPGPVRRLLLGPYRWYNVGYGCGWGCGYGCYSGCGYDCGYTPCCTDTPTNGAVPAQGGVPTPAKKPVAQPPAAMPGEPGPGAPMTPAPTPKTSATSAGNSGVLTVWVPYDAKVTVNGLETKSTGSRRQFISYGLQAGLSYKYVVKAEVVRNGQLVEDTRTVSLTAGQISAVAFGFNSTPAEQVATAH